MTSLRNAATAIWRFIWTLIHDVIVVPVRTGTLALGAHPPAIAAITWVVTGLIALLIAGIVAANPLRQLTDFIAVVDETGNSIVPAFLVPFMLFLAFALTLVLAGSQRCRLWLRILLLVTCSAILANLISSAMTVSATGPTVWVSWVALGLVVAYSFVIWTGRTRAAVDLFVLLGLILVISVLSYRGFVAGIAAITTRFDLITTTTLLVTLTSLAIPLAFVSGLSATALGVSIARGAGTYVARRAPVRIAVALLIIVILWQVIVIIPGLTERWALLGPVDAIGASIGGLALVGACWLIWRLTHRDRGAEPRSERSAVVIATAVALPIAYTLMSPILLSNVLALIGSSIVLSWSTNLQALVLVLVQILASDVVIALARFIMLIGLVVVGIVMARRGRPRLSAILLIDALIFTCILFGGGLLSALHLNWSVAEVGNVGLVIGIVLLIHWAVTRQLNADRLVVLFLVVLLAGLIRQADYFAIPIGFLIGASALALLVIGLVWGYLTDGGETHEDTPHYPRDGKLLLFLGNFLFGIAIVTWAAIGKQVSLSAQLSGTTALAVSTVGTAFIIITVLEVATARPASPTA